MCLRSQSVGLFLLLASIAQGQELVSDTNFVHAFTEGTLSSSFRYRYETVDQDSLDQDANASTLRSRLSYTTMPNLDISLVIEIDHIGHLGNDNFNSTRNGNSNRPIVADPDGLDLNQAALKYSGFENAEILVGRLKINRTNQRFIGGVGW